MKKKGKYGSRKVEGESKVQMNVMKKSFDKLHRKLNEKVEPFYVSIHFMRGEACVSRVAFYGNSTKKKSCNPVNQCDGM